MLYEVADLLVAEPSEPISNELPVIEARLVVPNQARCDKHAGQRIFETEPFHPRRHVGAPGRIEQFIQAIEDHYNPTGEQQPVHKSSGRVDGQLRQLRVHPRGPTQPGTDGVIVRRAA
jgi:hypothetical protein